MLTSVNKRLALTLGEPAGIGPDLCVALAQLPLAEEVVVIGDAATLQDRAQQLGLGLTLLPADYHGALPAGGLRVRDIPLAHAVAAGKPQAANAPALLAMLDAAIGGCLAGDYAAMVTAPLSKKVMCDYGLPFSGHTEYLAEKTSTARVVMMLTGSGMRVALATTHLPLADVAAAVTAELLTEVLLILHHDLQHKFGIAQPRILVAGLNPHAGEGGHLGQEEVQVIEPTLERLRQRGLQLIGPLPADTLFQPWYLQQADAVLAMYHDQGLPVLKYASFGQGVNVTLGLPIIRTSVDHGTAYDKAGSGQADPGSLFAAIALAQQLVLASRAAA